MLTLQGYGASPGVGDGVLHVYVNPHQVPKPNIIEDIEAELQRLDNALAVLREELSSLHSRALADGLSPEDASAFAVQREMLDDVDFLSSVHAAVAEHSLCTEYAVYSACKAYAMHLHTLEDDYPHGRGSDVMDASRRLSAILTGSADDPLKDVTARVILAADILLPAQTMYLSRDKIAAFVLREGTQNPQTALLMHSLGIPMVAGLGENFDKLTHGKRTMVDGESGLVVQDPCAQTLTSMAQKMLQYVREDRQAQMLRGQPAVTQHGVRIRLMANISLPEEVKRAVECDADGVGLFRSELLHAHEYEGTPSEDALYRAYREALLQMGGKPIVVRTLDYNLDKTLYCPDQPVEENPALGFRPIPLGLQQERYLMPQLRAMLRASAYGSLSILLPMIVCAQEIRGVKDMLGKARAMLAEEGKMSCGKIPVGAMIETPAAALTVDLIATEADFVSIGTNDLTQYVMVSDRKNARVSDTYDAKHPAVLRIVASAIRSAQSAGVPVCVCGEAAADPELTSFFAALHVDELSMSPVSLLKIKRVVRSLTAEQCNHALADCLQMKPHHNRAK